MTKKNQSRWLVYLLPLLLFVMVLGMLQVTAATTRIECESMTKSGQYTGNISSPFSGVALYANNDAISTTQNFSTSTSTFAVRGCSNNSNMARVDLQIDGQTKGSCYYGGSSPAVYTLSNISTGTGSHTVKLIVTTDTGSWDAYVDYLEISNGGSNPTPTPGGGPTPTQGGSYSGYVYLAFDDGPTSNTTTLVNNLRSAGAKATFFIWGNRVSGNMTGFNAIKSAGFSIQNHSYTHSHMTSWSYQQVYNDLQQCNQAIQNAGVAKPTRFRAPYLEVNSTIQSAASALGLSVVQPTVDTKDWNGASTSAIVSACNSLQNGGNALMHDGYSTTNAAIAQIVQNLKNRGLGTTQY